MITIGIVEDDPLSAAALQQLLRDGTDEFRVVATAASADGMLNAATSVPDVALLDVMLAGGTSLEENIGLLTEAGCAVLVISAQPGRREVARAIRATRVNFLSKAELGGRLPEAVRETAAGRAMISADILGAVLADPDPAPRFTAREMEILRLGASGMSAKQIARRLTIREDTVRDHVNRIRNKYRAAGRNVETPVDLHYAALEDGVIPDPRDRLRPPANRG